MKYKRSDQICKIDVGQQAVTLKIIFRVLNHAPSIPTPHSVSPNDDSSHEITQFQSYTRIVMDTRLLDRRKVDFTQLSLFSRRKSFRSIAIWTQMAEDGL